MTAATPAVPDLLTRLEQLRAEPERVCQWCMARPGEWCEYDCANPERRCHPSYVARYAAERGAYSDADAALIVAAVNALPSLVSALRAVAELADEWEEDSRDALKIGAAARDRGDREMHRISVRHARVAHHAASGLRTVLTAALDPAHDDERQDRP